VLAHPLMVNRVRVPDGPAEGVGGNAARGRLCGLRPPPHACDPFGRAARAEETAWNTSSRLW
jgi:hypothetical protein